MSNTEITIPYLDVGDVGWSMMRLPTDEYDRRRNQLVDRVYENQGVDVGACPEAWRDGPLMRWCWLILHVNGIEHDPAKQQPLITFGIDFSFADADIRSFIWAVS